jgi:hypothetical protein
MDSALENVAVGRHTVRGIESVREMADAETHERSKLGKTRVGF